MYLQRLTLAGIKSFSHLDLTFERPGTSPIEYAGLNFFVGGNASGKSTLLKAIAMAISGPNVANQQLVSPIGWIRHGEKRGEIEAWLSWDPIHDQFRDKGGYPSAEGFQAGLQFETDERGITLPVKPKNYYTPNRSRLKSAERGPWHIEGGGWYLGAYGPLRRLTGSSTEALRFALAAGKLSSCVTLFREDAALSESEVWLKREHARALEQKDQKRPPSRLVDDVQDFLNAGLLPAGFSISRVTVDHVYMSTPNGGELPLRDLSDGCRSAYALMLDIVHNMAAAYGADDLFDRSADGQIYVGKPGVILIDEIEAHLHPSWQRIICDWMKFHFPKVQFFITTHSPLILQSADPGGIFVLPLPQEIATGSEVRRLNPPEWEKVVLGRAEKILLGEAFGLKRTWSLRADKLVREWEHFVAIKEAKGLSAEESDKFNKISEQIELVFGEAPEGAGNQ